MVKANQPSDPFDITNFLSSDPYETISRIQLRPPETMGEMLHRWFTEGLNDYEKAMIRLAEYKRIFGDNDESDQES